MARRKARMKLPEPGLQGDYRGSCVICLQGCDTALALQGKADSIIAGLVELGIRDRDEAAGCLGEYFDCDPGMVPDGLLRVPVKCCASCVQKSGTGMRVALLGPAGVPMYRRLA